MVTIKEFLNKYKFELNTNYIIENNKLFSIAPDGTKYDKTKEFRPTRIVGSAKLIGIHFKCAAPHTCYHLIYGNKFYSSLDTFYSYLGSPLNEMVADLKMIRG